MTSAYRSASRSTHPPVWPYVAALSVSFLGDGVWYVALPLYVLQLTGSSLWVSFAVATDYLPSTLFALIAGYVTDRFSRRLQLVVFPFVSAIACVGIWLTHGTGIAVAGAVLLLAFTIQSSGEFFQTAAFASSPQLFGPESLMTWNSRVEAARQICMLVAPVLGGALFASLGARSMALIDGASFLVLAISALRLPNLESAGTAATSRVLDGFRDAIRVLLADKQMRDTVVTSFWGNAVAALVQVAIFLQAKVGFHLNGQTVGVLIALQGVGGLLGAFWVPWFTKKMPRTGLALSYLFAIDAISYGILLVGLLNIAVFACGLLLTSMAATGEAILVISLRQRAISSDLLGRVYSTIRLVVLFGYAPAAIASGALSARGVWLSFALSVLIATALAAFVRFGSIYRETR